MTLASTALLRLELETRPHHAPADAFWRALCAGGTSRADYLRCLATTYGFEAPVEAALAYTPRLRGMIDLRARSRAGFLAQDMLALGLTPSDIATLPQCFPIAPFSHAVEALGWLYVVERATLLHADVRRHVLDQLPDVGDAVAYLGAYRDVTSVRWHDLGHVIDRATRTERDRDELANAAHAAFRCMRDWQRGGEQKLVARGA